MRIRVKDLFKTTQIINDYGIFKQLITNYSDNFPFITDAFSYDLEYLFGYSAEKYIAPLWNKLYQENNIVPIELIDLIAVKYKDKWNRIYKAYIQADYDLLQDYYETKLETPNLTETETPDLTITNLDKTKSKITETNNEKNEDLTYGFNSIEAVNKDDNKLNSTNVVEGNLEDNISDRTEQRTGTNTVHKTGSNQIEISGLGRNTPQEMIEKELELRKRNFIDMLYKDLDKILTLAIY